LRDFLTDMWTRWRDHRPPVSGARWNPVDAFRPSALFMSASTLAATALCIGLALLTADWLITVLASLTAFVACARLTAAAIFHKRLGQNEDRASEKWERMHEAGSWSCAGLAGTLACATVLRSADPALHALTLVLVASYAGGISGRNAGRVSTTIGQSMAVLGPTAIGLWLTGDLGYRLLACVFATMMFGVAEISATTQRLIIEALRGQREKAQLAAKYERLARYDSLTGVENRMAMQMRLRDIYESNRKPQDAVAILWMDLDRFREINDTLGHMVGDHLLCAASEKLAEALDGRGYVARFGGDEFVMICPDASREAARAIAADVMEHFQHSFEVSGYNLSITASIGIAVGPQDGRDMDELMKHADVALYEAKRDGRNRAVSFTWAMKEVFNRIHEVENGLRNAIENGELALHYQPIFDLATGRIVTCEALMRWEHPRLGRVPPSEFIPAAERIGMIEPISVWALHEACSAAASWPADVRVAVNISPASLTSGELPRTVIATLLETGLPARRLELEVTESLFLENNRHTSQMLRELQLIGLKLVLDDFGTGYSSLSYLRSYSFDTIKVDQSFMAAIGSSREDQAIIQAVGQIASTLDMETVAEGIETEDQLRHAREAGFNSGQGFLLCPPQPRERMAEVLAAGTGMPIELAAPPPAARRRRA